MFWSDVLNNKIWLSEDKNVRVARILVIAHKLKCCALFDFLRIVPYTESLNQYRNRYRLKDLCLYLFFTDNRYWNECEIIERMKLNKRVYYSKS